MDDINPTPKATAYAAHQHSYELAMTKNNFEPIAENDTRDRPIYAMVEYAYLFCKRCGSVTKSKVKKES